MTVNPFSVHAPVIYLSGEALARGRPAGAVHCWHGLLISLCAVTTSTRECDECKAWLASM